MAPPVRSGNILIGSLEKPPPAQVHLLVRAHIGPEQDPVLISLQKLRGRSWLAAQFVAPSGEIHIQIRKPVENLAQCRQVVTLIAEMAGNESRARLRVHQAIPHPEDLRVRRHIVPILVVPLIARRALLMVIGRPPGRRVIRHMDVDWQFQFSALFPEEAEPWIVRVQPLGAARVARPFFRQLPYPARSLVITPDQLRHRPLGIIRGFDPFGLKSTVKLKPAWLSLEEQIHSRSSSTPVAPLRTTAVST